MLQLCIVHRIRLSIHVPLPHFIETHLLTSSTSSIAAQLMSFQQHVSTHGSFVFVPIKPLSVYFTRPCSEGPT